MTFPADGAARFRRRQKKSGISLPNICFRAGILVLLLVVHLHAATSLKQGKFHTLSHQAFNVYFEKEDSTNAQKIFNILQAEYPPLSSSLQTKVKAPIGVFMTANEDDFNRATGGSIPHWGHAAADAGRQLIFLKSPRWTNSTDDPRITIIHELTHILVGQAAGKAAVPRWLNEGLAIYYSGDQNYFAGVETSQAQLADQLIPLKKINGLLAFQQTKAHLAYQESYLAVIFLVEQYGESSIAILLQALREKRTIEAAFEKAFGTSLAQFELDWKAFLKERYKWAFLIEFDKLLWFFIIVLLFAAVTAVYFRRQKTLKKWANEAAGAAENGKEI